MLTTRTLLQRQPTGSFVHAYRHFAWDRYGHGKNMLKVLAKEFPPQDVLILERFAASPYHSKYSCRTVVDISLYELHELQESRIVLTDGGLRKHSFVRHGNDLYGLPRGSLTIKLSFKLQGGPKELIVSSFGDRRSMGVGAMGTSSLRHFRSMIGLLHCDQFDALLQHPFRSVDSSPSSLKDGVADFDASVPIPTKSIRSEYPPRTTWLQSRRPCSPWLPPSSIIITHSLRGVIPKLEDVEYTLLNKHYVPADMSFRGLPNTYEADAEMLLPPTTPIGVDQGQDHPQGSSD